MDADFISNGVEITLPSGVSPHLDIKTIQGSVIPAITTCMLVHFHYQSSNSNTAPYRRLRSLFAIAVPHAALKSKYNPSAQVSFFGQGKHSPARGEDPRIRIYFERLRSACPWRLQELQYQPGQAYATPIWRDTSSVGPIDLPFEFIGR